VIDEGRRIGALLEHLGRLAGLHEVIVVDGGSSDDTVRRARAAGGVRLASGPRGRASQLNAGAALATGDVLLLLHVDVTPPFDLADRVEETLRDPATVAGAFRTWTINDTATTLWFAPLLHLADLRSRYTCHPYGDQALFVRTHTFRAVGGVPELPIMEDLELARRLRRAGKIRRVPARVLVSGRRFVARPLHATLMANLIPLAYRLGVSPDRLRRWYDAAPVAGRASR